MDCKIPRRVEKIIPWKTSLSQGRCSVWQSLRMAALDSKHPWVLGKAIGHQAQVPGEGCPWEHSWNAVWEAMEIKFIPSTRRVLCAWQRQDCGKEAGLMHPLLTVHASCHSWDQHPLQGAHSQPWDHWIHPRHFSGAPWLVGVSWERAPGLAGSSGSDLCRAGRSGGHRERIYLHQESAWSQSGN